MAEGKCTMAGPVPFDDGADYVPGDPGPVLGRDQILDAVDVEIRRIPVPEWGGSVFIRSISAGDWDNFENSLVRIENGTQCKADLADYRARFAAMIICDEAGNRLFTSADVKRLSEKSRAALDRILEAGKDMNGVSEGDEEGMIANLRPIPDGVS